MRGGALVFTTTTFLLLQVAGSWARDAPSGDATIGAPFAGSTISITTTSRLAGAIDSLRWKGKEFINSYDHGRQLQSSILLDGAGACFNPTEAGSRNDGTGDRSTSKLLSLTQTSNSITTRTQMAFWLAPGDRAINCPPDVAVRAQSALSSYILTKRVMIGYGGIPNAIEHNVTFTLPAAHEIGLFEALTAYLPPEFSKFWVLDPATARVNRLSDGPGEQRFPVIFSTSDERFALGVVGDGLPQANWPTLGYGRWNFGSLKGTGNATVKWNCVFRGRRVSAGDHTFRCFSVVGTMKDVMEGIAALLKCEFRQDCRVKP